MPCPGKGDVVWPPWMRPAPVIGLPKVMILFSRSAPNDSSWVSWCRVHHPRRPPVDWRHVRAVAFLFLCLPLFWPIAFNEIDRLAVLREETSSRSTFSFVRLHVHSNSWYVLSVARGVFQKIFLRVVVPQTLSQRRERVGAEMWDFSVTPNSKVRHLDIAKDLTRRSVYYAGKKRTFQDSDFVSGRVELVSPTVLETRGLGEMSVGVGLHFRIALSPLGVP